MIRVFAACLGLCAALAAPLVSAQSQECLDCHLDSEGGPIHALLQTKHGGLVQSCRVCHGKSEAHTSAPTVNSPDVSFGPRWTANTAEQDGSCLTCHKNNVAKHWDESLHMANNVTCVTCHDVHQAEAAVLTKSGQFDTCTTCHKTQKTGIHGKERMVRMNPECTTCHNPHADQRPQGVMLENDSAGCRRCHNLEVMARSDKVSEKAKSFHRVMESGNKTCIGCHRGVAHGDPEAAELFMPLPESERVITLFSPGQSDSDWLLTKHPGAQPLRQGSTCRQCHRGEEVEMGESLGETAPTSVPVTTSFESDEDALVTTLTWAGPAEQAQISLLWGFGDYEPINRGGCWAACHGDMNGMSFEQNAGVPKYLWASRAQQRAIGQQAVVKGEEQLAEEMAAGHFAEMWRVDLRTGGLSVATLLAEPVYLHNPGHSATVDYSDGVWTVEVTRPLKPGAPLLPLSADERYTFGVALHGQGRKGAEHWVSLPMTLSRDREDTDFITR